MLYSLNKRPLWARNTGVAGQWAVRFLQALCHKVIVGVETRRPSSQATYGSSVSGFGWCDIMKITTYISLLMLALFASTQAYAAQTAGGATIHNAVTVSFNGHSSQVFVDVKVRTIATAPNITVDTTTQSATPGALVTYNYTVSNATNGSDTFALTAASVDASGISAPALNLNASNTAFSNILLGASVASAANTVVNTVVIPAGSEVGFADGDTLRILNNTYQIAVGGIAVGSPQNLTSPEVPTVITLIPDVGSPNLAAGAVVAGAQVGEQQTFSLVFNAGAPSGSHTINLGGVTTALDSATQSPVAFTTSQVNGNETVTVVASATIIFIKDVRNLTRAGAFGEVGIQAQSTDILEYRTRLTEPSNVVAQQAGTLTDEVPLLTTYIPGSTTLNGVNVPDGAGNTLPLSAANGGLKVNSVGAGLGVIAPGQTATVIFKVKVN